MKIDHPHFLIFSPSSDLVKEVVLNLQDKFKCKALGDVSFYLGLHIQRDVEKRCMRGPEEESVGEEERRRFHSLVGSLMYAAVNTRPDIAFATGQLARVVQCPNEEQVAAGMRVAKYLGQTLTVGLQYSAAAQRCQKGADGVDPGRLFLTVFSDACYASEPEDMTSVGGFICCVGGGPTAWESKKQVDQALSTVESEYMALFRAIREIMWQRRLLAELGEEQQGPTPLYYDIQGAIALAKNPVLHGLTKHMRVKWHWTRSMVAASDVELHYVKTTRQPADMMTKRLVGAELHPLDNWVLDTGAAWMMTLRKELLDDVPAAPINEVCSASGHALKVAGAGRAVFKGADGKPVVLHDVLLVPDLKANLICLRKLAKAGVSTSTDGARTYMGQLGVRVLWNLHESKDVYRSMWRLPALAWRGGGQAGEGSASQGECNAVGGVGVKVSVGDESWVRLERWLGRKLPVDMLRVFSCMAVAHKKQPETKVSQQMEQITRQLDLTPSVWEEGEEAAAESGDEEKLQEAPAGGGGGVEAIGSTSEAARPEGEQQQGKAKVPTLPERRKPKGVVMKLTVGADVAEQQLGNEEALLILPYGNDPEEEDEPAYCVLAPAPEEPASMEEALAGPDREKWLVSRNAEYQSLLAKGHGIWWCCLRGRKPYSASGC
ncbi:unnamed protein product [Closterium sp. NIES-54]